MHTHTCTHTHTHTHTYMYAHTRYCTFITPHACARGKVIGRVVVVVIIVVVVSTKIAIPRDVGI